jgi:hypothetical protein
MGTTLLHRRAGTVEHRGRHIQWTVTSERRYWHRISARRDRANGCTGWLRSLRSLLVSFTAKCTQPTLHCLKQLHCCGSRSIRQLRETLPSNRGACWPGRRARCENISTVISAGRCRSRISVRSFSVARRTFLDRLSAPSGSHRTLSWCDVEWNSPLNICLQPMRR